METGRKHIQMQYFCRWCVCRCWSKTSSKVSEMVFWIVFVIILKPKKNIWKKHVFYLYIPNSCKLCNKLGLYIHSYGLLLLFCTSQCIFFLLKNITKCTHVASINRNSKRSLSTETCSYFIFYLINFILVFHRAFVELYKCF